MPDSPENASSVSLRSVGIVTLLSVGQLILLFVIQLVLAEVFGASEQLDAYLSAYALPLVVGGILSGALGSVVVPLYNEQLAKHGPATAEAELSRVGVLLGLVSALLALLMMVGAGWLTGLFYAEFEPAATHTTVEVLRILAWLIPLNTLTGFLFAIYHVRRRFFLPAFSGLFGPALTIFLFVYVLEHTVVSLAWSVLAGALCGVGLLLPGFPRGERLTAFPRREALQRLLVLITPLLIGAAYSRLDVLIDRPLADELSTGTISHMGYAWRIATAVYTLGVSGLSIVIYPSLARHAAEKNFAQLRGDLAEGARLLSVVLIPGLAGILFCGEPIIRVLFERGAFTSRDVEAVARLLNLYTGMILAAGIAELVSRTYFALGRTWLPTVIGMTGFTIGAIVKFFVVDDFGAEGLVAVTSMHYLLNAASLVALLHLVGISGYSTGLLATTARSLAAAAVAIAPAVALMQSATPMRVLIGIIVAVCLYPLVLRLLGDEFAQRAWETLRSWLWHENSAV